MIEKVVAELTAGGYPEDTPVAVVEKVSWPDQQTVQGTLADIAVKIEKSAIYKTAMILVGRALADDSAAVSKLYDAGFSHEYRRKK